MLRFDSGYNVLSYGENDMFTDLILLAELYINSYLTFYYTAVLIPL